MWQLACALLGQLLVPSTLHRPLHVMCLKSLNAYCEQAVQLSVCKNILQTDEVYTVLAFSPFS